jgi:glycosyltransferase involved in cell wall biosynthesis
MQSHDGLQSEIERLGLVDRVKVAGYLPAEALPCIYNLARLMVFPSLFEGFGIPLVEAMASGCPIACADRTSLPEVAADVAVYFDPHSAADMADKIRQVWNDDDALESMARRGIERAKLFTWQETVRKTQLVYARVGSEVR